MFFTHPLIRFLRRLDIVGIYKRIALFVGRDVEPVIAGSRNNESYASVKLVEPLARRKYGLIPGPLRLADRTAVLVDQVEPQAELLIVGAVVTAQKQEIRQLENQRIPTSGREKTVNAKPMTVDHSVRAGSGYFTA